jgi:uncharacterized surface protein with fasciclin (FAS1) repeats
LMAASFLSPSLAISSVETTSSRRLRTFIQRQRFLQRKRRGDKAVRSSELEVGSTQAASAVATLTDNVSRKSKRDRRSRVLQLVAKKPADPLPTSRDLRRRRRHKKSKKGKGKGKGSGKGKGKGKDHKGGELCRELDFSDFYGTDDDDYNDDDERRGRSKKGHGRRRRRQLAESPTTALVPAPQRPTTTTRALQFDGEFCAPSVLETARDETSIFAQLLEWAGLEEIFECAGPFTLLAPSNAALEENPDLLSSFFHPRNIEAVQEMLLYHIVPGLFLAEDLVEGPLQTLLGDRVDVTVDPTLMLNQAEVTMADILACNGIIHVLDDVLIPTGMGQLPRDRVELFHRSYVTHCASSRFARVPI